MSIDFCIEEFSAPYVKEVISLITNIQEHEYQIQITADEQPDLCAIEDFYQTGNGNFWIALHENSVVGSIALIDIGDGNVALRKMFVQKEYRGAQSGVAKGLLEEVLNWAKSRNLSNIYLGTTDKFLAAHKFYEKNEFQRVEKSQLPSSFPVMEVDSVFFKRQIANNGAYNV